MPKKCICVRATFQNSKRYEVGDELTVADSAKVPAHFELKSNAAPKKQEPADDEPKTLHDLAKQEAKNGPDKHALVNMRKDDLVGYACDLGLSKGRDLNSLTKAEIADVIVEHQVSGGMFS